MKTVDQEFIDLLKANDDSAYKKLLTYCYKYALSYTRNDQHAEEVAAEALFKIVAEMPTYKVKHKKGTTINATFKGWVRTITFHCYIDWLEDQKRAELYGDLSRALDLDENEKAAISGNIACLDELLSTDAFNKYPFRNNPEWQVMVNQVIGILSKVGDSEIRAAGLLKFMYGFGIDEIAAAMHETEARVTNLIYRDFRPEAAAALKRRGIDRSSDISPDEFD